MGKASAKRVPVGHRTGTKRSDFHWTGEDGSTWDSRFEYVVYTAAQAANFPLERCTESDTISYILPIRGGICAGCEGTDVGQRRTYTPDFRYNTQDSAGNNRPAYIEVKGYLRAKERSLLRAMYNKNKDIALTVILQRTYRVTKPNKSGDGSIVSWFNKFLPKVNVYVWTGKIPAELTRHKDRAVPGSAAKRVRRSNRASNKGTATATARIDSA